MIQFFIFPFIFLILYNFIYYVLSRIFLSILVDYILPYAYGMPISIKSFISLAKESQIAEVILFNFEAKQNLMTHLCNLYVIKFVDGTKRFLMINPNIIDDLSEKIADVNIMTMPAPYEKCSYILSILCTFITTILTAYIIFTKIFKPIAAVVPPSNLLGEVYVGRTVVNSTVKFNDIGGLHQVKNECADILDQIKNRDKYVNHNIKLSKGVVFYGLPGTGKTLLAKAIAGETSAIFIELCASELESPFIGQSAERIRNLFKVAREYKQPVIIFIDELDSLPDRKKINTAFHTSYVNQLLSEIDGMQDNSNIFIIGATNNLNDIDSALVRTGRLDKKIYFHMPNFAERLEIIDIYAKKLNINLSDALKTSFAELTNGRQGADICAIINDAMYQSIKHNAPLSLSMLDQSYDDITLGLKRDMANKKEIYRTAVHEAGHALIGYLLQDVTQFVPVKITVQPRAKVLGHVSFHTKDNTQESSDLNLTTYNALFSQICVSLGGFVSEKLIFGDKNISVGASSDLNNVRAVANNIIAGGCFGKNKHYVPEVFYSNFQGFNQTLSDKTSQALEKEIEELINKAIKYVENLMKDNIDIIKDLTNHLITSENHTMHKEELFEFFENRINNNKQVKS